MVQYGGELKAEGNVHMKAGEWAKARAAYMQAVEMADTWLTANNQSLERVVPSEWPGLFHMLALCRSNCAQALLKLEPVDGEAVVVQAQTAREFIDRRVVPHFKQVHADAKAELDAALAAAKEAGVSAASSSGDAAAPQPLLEAVRTAKAKWDVAKDEYAKVKRFAQRTLFRLGRGLILMQEFQAALRVLTHADLVGDRQALALAHSAKKQFDAQQSKSRAMWKGALQRMSSEDGGEGADPTPAEESKPQQALASPEPSAQTQLMAEHSDEEEEEEIEAGTFLGLSASTWGYVGLAAGAAALAGAAAYGAGVFQRASKKRRGDL